MAELSDSTYLSADPEEEEVAEATEVAVVDPEAEALAVVVAEAAIAEAEVAVEADVEDPLEEALPLSKERGRCCEQSQLQGKLISDRIFLLVT